ncbi:hypothetical protein SG34_000130 [Thalassomonas viridans]|uniref:Lipoprotein n=2 Tax=Thalassomonas viridans TaxID=137584 RepID=A0AAE9Z7A5_9GAMM|nr:hypothetical protein SG34_000130 [Thalassomonas viridans]
MLKTSLLVKSQALALCLLILIGCDKQAGETLLAEAVPAAQMEKKAGEKTYPYRAGDEIPALAYIEHKEVYNAEAVIPPQCYTKTDGVNNPCFACHQSYGKEKTRTNMMRDGDLQGAYEFSDLGVTNHWKNLFVNRRPLIDKISDASIKDWITTDNYSALIAKLKNDPGWQGEITPIANLPYPDKAFNEFGLANDQSYWVAFNYKPFPSTFWPTNGSTGDAMIRLPAPFRQLNGSFSLDVYFANLALVEMAVKDLAEISLPPVSELAIGQDLNGDGKISGQIEVIKRRSHYLGDAAGTSLAHMLYPKDTEFLHTVRYIGVDDQGQIYNAPRMKEVRYMKKHSFKSKEMLATAYYQEEKEKHFENLPQVRSLGDKGINNNFGWTINAYIEDGHGQLRQQYQQELAFCGGCHKTIGATIDQTFSFPRKVEGARGWGYINLAKQQDVPNIGEQQGEFLTYMQRAGGGDEFRQNREMLQRWFDNDGRVNEEKVKGAGNLYQLITPSPRRALDLNKAYYTLMKEQSYIFGRDAMLSGADNVLEQVDESQAPLAPEHRYQWDLRLNWHPRDTDISLAQQGEDRYVGS